MVLKEFPNGVTKGQQYNIGEKPTVTLFRYTVVIIIIIIIIINSTLARSLEPVVTECKEHTIHTQTQVVASRKPKEIKRTHEGEANFTA